MKQVGSFIREYPPICSMFKPRTSYATKKPGHWKPDIPGKSRRRNHFSDKCLLSTVRASDWISQQQRGAPQSIQPPILTAPIHGASKPNSDPAEQNRSPVALARLQRLSGRPISAVDPVLSSGQTQSRPDRTAVQLPHQTTLNVNYRLWRYHRPVAGRYHNGPVEANHRLDLTRSPNAIRQITNRGIHPFGVTPIMVANR